MIKGFITVQLSASDSTRAGAIARQDIERSDITTVTALAGSKPAQAVGAAVNFVSHPGDIVTSLGSVVSKLAVCVQIVDQAAKVSVRTWYETRFP
jgi:hypothetical protein